MVTVTDTLLATGAKAGADEPAVGVQHGAGDRADCVEQHLGQEEPEEERTQHHLALAQARVGRP